MHSYLNNRTSIIKEIPQRQTAQLILKQQSLLYYFLSHFLFLGWGWSLKLNKVAIHWLVLKLAVQSSIASFTWVLPSPRVGRGYEKRRVLFSRPSPGEDPVSAPTLHHLCGWMAGHPTLSYPTYYTIYLFAEMPPGSWSCTNSTANALVWE